MIAGNPWTGVPGIAITVKAAGGVLIAVGTALTAAGDATSLSQIVAAAQTLLADQHWPALMAGIGLIAAKDWNVTGGTRAQ
jgi:hypothetical protein